MLLLSYGGPRSESEVEPFLRHVTGGRPLSPEMVAEFQARYGRIGGRSPLPEIVDELVVALENRLRSAGRYRVTVGNLHSSPSLADAIAELQARHVSRVVAIALVPQYSAATVGRYLGELDSALEAAGRPFPVAAVRRWTSHLALVEAFAERLQTALAALDPAERAASEVVFTAHSVPIMAVSGEDPFEAELHTTADGVARRAGIAKWRLAYQSVGRAGGEWFGPSVADALVALAAEGKRAVVVVPIHFLSDNAEILYDLDIELRSKAEELGLRFERAESLNTSPRLVEALADLALDPPVD